MEVSAGSSALPFWQSGWSMVNRPINFGEHEMIKHITEGLVLQAAREWSARKNKSEAITVANASETMAALKGKLKAEDYEEALTELYREYEES